MKDSQTFPDLLVEKHAPSTSKTRWQEHAEGERHLLMTGLLSKALSTLKTVMGLLWVDCQALMSILAHELLCGSSNGE